MTSDNRRILFVKPTVSTQGGVVTWLVRAVQCASGHGWDPVVGLTRGLQYNRADDFRLAHPQLPSVVIDGRGMDQEGRIREVLRCIRAVKPGIVVPLGVHDAFWAACRWKQRNRGGRLILRNQGLLPPLLADLCRFGPVSDLVACNSRLVAKFAVAHAAVPPERVWNIPNGADPLAPTTRVRREQASRTSPLRLGYVGRLTQGDKRVLDLVPLCQRLRLQGIPFTLDIVGDGPADDELRRGLHREEYHDIVRFHGSLHHAQVCATIYPKLDALLLLSASESFGIVLVEAMMQGVVPITSQYLGFFTEGLVVDGKNGLSFPIGDMDMAAACVGCLAQDRGLLNALAEEGWIRTNRQYTWEHSFERWNEAFQWVRDQQPRSVAGFGSVTRPVSGILDRWGIPPGVIHAIRRLRRHILGSPIPAGGEEWPLFGGRYAEEELVKMADVCQELDRISACNPQMAQRNERVVPASGDFAGVHRPS